MVEVHKAALANTALPYVGMITRFAVSLGVYPGPKDTTLNSMSLFNKATTNSCSTHVQAQPQVALGIGVEFQQQRRVRHHLHIGKVTGICAWIGALSS